MSINLANHFPARQRRAIAGRGARAAVLLVLAAVLPACSDAPPEAERELREPDGSFAVGRRSFTFVDPTRATPPHGEVPGSDSRVLETRLLYPAQGEPDAFPVDDAPTAAGGPFPLVAFAHGFLGIADVYLALLGEVASAGYVIVAPNFPLTNGFTPGGAEFSDYVNQPGDVSFVIDEVLRLSDDPAGPIAGLVDGERIGAAGQSLGGITTFGVAFNGCCADPRIRAAVPMAGRLSPFPGEWFREAGPPVLIIHGDADETVAYSSATEAFALARPPKVLLTLLGGDHILPYVAVRPRRPTFGATVAATIAFLDHFLKRERGALDRLLAVHALEVAALEARLD